MMRIQKRKCHHAGTDGNQCIPQNWTATLLQRTCLLLCSSNATTVPIQNETIMPAGSKTCHSINANESESDYKQGCGGRSCSDQTAKRTAAPQGSSGGQAVGDSAAARGYRDPRRARACTQASMICEGVVPWSAMEPCDSETHWKEKSYLLAMNSSSSTCVPRYGPNPSYGYAPSGWRSVLFGAAIR